MRTAAQVRSFHDLIVWQRAMDLAVRVYELTRNLPNQYRFGLGDQLNRSALSIPSNIAEGHGRHHRGNYRYHLGVAKGAIQELETQLLLAIRLDAFRPGDVVELFETIDEIQKMLAGLVRRLYRVGRGSKPVPDNPSP